MPFNINITEFISLPYPVFDVRSPIEFEKGHIPDAINIPVFTNEERAIVGTAYFKQGRSEAIKIGLEKVQTKLLFFVESVNNITKNKDIRLHCWRGGMRSQNMAWLLELAGYKVYLLNGGYKSYRNFVIKYFENNFPLIVIGGMTGTGKTEILNHLETFGEQVVDMEALANHKGSVFGHLGQFNQPTNEYFENLLYQKFCSFSPGKPIWLEDESLSIGKVFIPKLLYNQIIKAPMIVIERSFSERINRLINEYSFFDKELLIQSVIRINRRIGGDVTNNIITNIQKGNFNDAISTILKYYDKLYNLCLKNHSSENCVCYNVDGYSNNEITNRLLLLSEKINYGTN